MVEPVVLAQVPELQLEQATTLLVDLKVPNAQGVQEGIYPLKPAAHLVWDMTPEKHETTDNKTQQFFLIQQKKRLDM